MVLNQNRHIIDLPTLLGYQLNKIDFSDITSDSINYGWGDESEVAKWINNKDRKSQFVGNVYKLENGLKTPIKTDKKYPLIWLEQTPRSFGESNGNMVRFNDSRIIISCHTKPEILNPERWRLNIFKLQSIAEIMLQKLRGYIGVGYRNGKKWYRYSQAPKYSISEDGAQNDKANTLDWWDAVILELDLIVNGICKDKEYLENYLNCKN